MIINLFERNPFFGEFVFIDRITHLPLLLNYGPDDLCIFWGGEDISPSLYGQYPDGAHALVIPSPRDMTELAAFQICKARKIPMLGICRGSQILWTLLGGKLKQHITGHGRSHKMKQALGPDILVSSTHHQCATVDDDTYPVNMSILGTDSNGDVIEAWTNYNNVVGVQFHPEYGESDGDMTKFVKQALHLYTTTKVFK